MLRRSREATRPQLLQWPRCQECELDLYFRKTFYMGYWDVKTFLYIMTLCTLHDCKVDISVIFETVSKLQAQISIFVPTTATQELQVNKE